MIFLVVLILKQKLAHHGNFLLAACYYFHCLTMKSFQLLIATAGMPPLFPLPDSEQGQYEFKLARVFPNNERYVSFFEQLKLILHDLFQAINR